MGQHGSPKINESFFPDEGALTTRPLPCARRLEITGVSGGVLQQNGRLDAGHRCRELGCRQGSRNVPRYVLCLLYLVSCALQDILFLWLCGACAVPRNIECNFSRPPQN